MVRRHVVENGVAAAAEVKQREYQHVGERRAHEVADANIGGIEQSGVYIDGQLGQRCARSQ